MAQKLLIDELTAETRATCAPDVTDKVDKGALEELAKIIKDGITEDELKLAIKSTLDGVTSIVFAATLGWGVFLSAASVLLVQGSLTLVAFLIHAGLSDLQTGELTAAGGIAVLGIALGLLEVKVIKVANFLPALLVAPLLAGVLHAVGLL